MDASARERACRVAGVGVMAAVIAGVGCVPPTVAVTLPPYPADGLSRMQRAIEYDADVTWLALPNGLRVALIPDPLANVVSVDVRYMVGGAEDPPDKPGLAHLVEHVMFAQRAAPEGPTTADLLQLAALTSNAATTADATQFYATALAANLDQLLAIEAGRLASGCHGIDPPTFERERSVVGHELAERGPQTAGDRIRAELLGADHVYVHGAGGHDVSSFTLADVCRFVDAYYTPGRAVLLIGGRFDAASARAAVAARFGPLERRDAAAPVELAPVAVPPTTTVLRVPVENPSVIVALPGEPWGSPDALDTELLDALAQLELEAAARHARWVSRISHGRLGGARASVRYFAIEVDDRGHLGDAAELVSKTMAKLASGVPDALLAFAVAARRTELLEAFESLSGRARMCADALQFHHDEHCGLAALRRLNDDIRMRVQLLASRSARAFGRVVKVLPHWDREPGITGELVPPIAEIDAPVWHGAVDRTEAGRPIPLPAGLRSPRVTDFMLPTGLRIVLAGGFVQPIVEARLVFPVGWTGASLRDDSIARLAAQLLRPRLSRFYLKDEIAVVRRVFSLGATLSVRVTDRTMFAIRGPAAFADWYVWRLLWLVRDGAYPVDEVETVFDVPTGHAVGRQDEHDRYLGRLVHRLLLGRNHPYVRAPDAADTDIPTSELARFRDKHYLPQGATLIIAGGFEPNAMRRTVEQLFGDWEREGAPAAPPASPPMQPDPGPTWLVDDDPGAAQVRLVIGFATRSVSRESLAARAVLDALVNRRLAEVRSRMGASYGLDARYDRFPAGDVFRIEGRVDAARAGQVLREITTDLAQLRASSDALVDDFVRARREALAVVLADPSMPSATAARLEQAVVTGTAFGNEALAAAVAATTWRDVARLIAQDLQSARMVAVLRGRPADTAAALAAAGISGARQIR